ncbi:MAG: hypothetical protein GF330_05015 [Candidatus Eisenbacteria bacterium]|nr:hypothetical protein [Candidatus Eisenbacteria bacterium]
MRRSACLSRLLILAGLALLAVPPLASAERASESEMDLVCENFLTYTLAQQGTWSGEPAPWIRDVQDVLVGGELLARNYLIAPRGHVVVPVLKELPPIKAYSEAYDLDAEASRGFAALLREVLADRARRFRERYGSLDATQPATGSVLLGRQHRQRWARFLAPPGAFAAGLAEEFLAREQVGPLLTTVWHQSGPYNDECPMGDGGRCVVGCVATATAQVMRYWSWPPVGTGDFCYFWDGDQSCGGNYGGGELCADFSDAYDWAHMPNSCSGGCTSEEEAALAELNYEVGISELMDYGRCGSGTFTNLCITALRDFFRYDPELDQENRSEYSAASWFGLIQSELNAGRVMVYRITGHAIVCDGWRDTGGQNEYHMNYGWGGPYNTWFAVDELYISNDPMQEYLIRGIQPDLNTVFQVRADGSGDLPTIQDAVDAAIDGNIIELDPGVYTGAGNRDIDLRGKAITIRAGGADLHDCVIDCQGSPADPHQGFLARSGETAETRIQGLTIRNGYAGAAALGGGAIECSNGAAPTIRNCLFLENASLARGGALFCSDGATPMVEQCIFVANQADADGGAVCGYGAAALLTRCTFVANEALQGSAIAAIDTGAWDLTGLILASAPAGEPVACLGDAAVTLHCCDVYDNAAGDWVGCLAGQEGINGNISLDPLFCDPSSHDYALDSASPCVPFTDPNPECDLIGALGVGCGAIVVHEDGSGPFPTIQAGIDAAIEGGTVLLADGIFVGDGNRDIDFQGKAMALQSQSGDPASCVIDCQGTAQDWHRGFSFTSGETAETRIEGITVRGGYADIAAAAYIDDSSPAFRNVVFADHYADFGGAVRCRGTSAPLFEDVVFRGNGARVGGAIYSLGGDCVPVIRNCTFYDNYATNYGAALRCYDFSDPVIENTIIAFSSEGVSISCANSGMPVISCTDIYGNAGGDWVDPFDDQLGVDGNFSADPLFCDAPGGDLTLDAESPCTANNAPDDCGLIGAYDIGCGDTSDTPTEAYAALPLRLSLPVPFPPGEGLIRYSIPAEGGGPIELAIYDLGGRRIRTLVAGPQAPGHYRVAWDGRDDASRRTGSGVYYCRLVQGDQSRTRTLVLFR